MKVYILLLLCYNFAHLFQAVRADEPALVAFMNKLYNISARQTVGSAAFIKDTWIIPEVGMNPSIGEWIFDVDDSNSASQLRNKVIIDWCSGVYACFYIVMETGENKEDWKRVKKDNLEFFDKIKGTGRRPMNYQDIRIYSVNGSMYMVYVLPNTIQSMQYGEVHFNHRLDALFLLTPPIDINIDHEMGVRHQKNWSPFAYTISADDPTLGPYKGQVENLFIYGVNPHRIVYINETIYSPDRTKQTGYAHTVALSEVILSPSTEKLWNYGQPRGGTPAVLIDTMYGPRYITFFHSQGKFATDWLLTYYMGGYIFNSEPPFEITHFSPEPIIPHDLYDEKNGWAFKAIDHIVFPTGLLARGNKLYVTVGHNDQSGWMVEIDKDAFIRSLKPVRTQVSKNGFIKKFLETMNNINNITMN